MNDPVDGSIGCHGSAKMSLLYAVVVRRDAMESILVFCIFHGAAARAHAVTAALALHIVSSVLDRHACGFA